MPGLRFSVTSRNAHLTQHNANLIQYWKLVKSSREISSSLDTLAVSAAVFVRMFPSSYLLSQSVSFKTRLLANILKYFHSIGKNWADLIGIVIEIVIFYNNSNELC